MTNINNPTPTTVKNNARVKAFDLMVEMFGQAYGLDKVHRIGDTEIAVEVDTAPTGEPIYAVYSPTVKDYCDRTTKTKTIKAYDLTAEVNAYNALLAKREADKAEAAEKKAAKVKADKAKREANAKAKAEHAKAKADKVDALTAYKNARLNDVTVKAKT